MTFTYKEPRTVQVAILANSPEEADHRLKLAIGYDTAPSDLEFKIQSCELLEENVEADEDEVDAEYKELDTRTIN